MIANRQESLHSYSSVISYLPQITVCKVYSITSLVEIVNRFEIESTTIEKIVALGCKIEKIVTLGRKIENICITIWRFTVRLYCMIKCHDISQIFRTAPQDQPLPIKQTFALTV